MSEIVTNIGKAMSDSLGAPLAVILLSMIPIAEARLAIPFGISMQLSPGAAFGYAFLGSTMMAPILLIVFIPLIKALSKTKLFSRIGNFLYDKFEKKSRSLADDAKTEEQNKSFLSPSDLKRMGGTALFVAVPLPLTGVWTGSAVASILKMDYLKALIGVAVGNAAACGIITLLCVCFSAYVTQITWAFFIIAVLVVIALLVKLALYKPDKQTAADNIRDTEKE